MALPYRRNKAGISAVQISKSGVSICRACDGRIAYNSIRFEYWWMRNRPPGYLHPKCVVLLPAEDRLDLTLDLHFLQPEDDLLKAEVSAALEALHKAHVASHAAS